MANLERHKINVLHIPYNANNPGGKGESLLRLDKEGINVANGFIIPTESFELFLDSSSVGIKLRNAIVKGELDKSLVVQLKKFIINSKLPEEVMNSMHYALRHTGLNKDKLIVRSSANVEDSKEKSFAGQFKTIVNVEPQNIQSAILDVYASLYNNAAISYAESMNLIEARMAVVVQEMINTDFAGVAFTISPIGKTGSMTIEYVVGQGEALVSGKTKPCNVKLDRSNFNFISEWVPSGVEACMLRETVREVAALAMHIETIYNMPMDIEWGIARGKLFVFQARPITHLKRIC